MNGGGVRGDADGVAGRRVVQQHPPTRPRYHSPCSRAHELEGGEVRALEPRNRGPDRPSHFTLERRILKSPTGLPGAAAPHFRWRPIASAAPCDGPPPPEYGVCPALVLRNLTSERHPSDPSPGGKCRPTSETCVPVATGSGRGVPHPREIPSSRCAAHAAPLLLSSSSARPCSLSCSWTQSRATVPRSGRGWPAASRAVRRMAGFLTHAVPFQVRHVLSTRFGMTPLWRAPLWK